METRPHVKREKLKPNAGNHDIFAKITYKSQRQTLRAVFTIAFPILGVPSFEKGTTTVSVNFSGELQGLKGKAYIDPRKDGSTRVKMRFDDMKMAPKQKRFVL